jgi:hypothetical protein
LPCVALQERVLLAKEKVETALAGVEYYSVVSLAIISVPRIEQRFSSYLSQPF